MAAGGNPPQSFATLYLGSDLATVTAEFERMAARAGLASSNLLPRHVYRYEIVLHSTLDLRSEDARQLVGINLDAIHADDLSACQSIGFAARHAGREEVIAPSAAGTGTVLAVFLDRLHAESTVRDVDFELWSDEA